MVIGTTRATHAPNLLSDQFVPDPALSLLVGGIGIMNIMLVSITERTREIGTRLAIGALEGEVLLQFLVEAVTLFSRRHDWHRDRHSSIHGAVASDGVPFSFDAGINAIAFLFSAGIGVLFGYLPARRAAQLDPIQALRHDKARTLPRASQD